MNVKLYYAPERDTAGRPVTYSDGGRFAGFVRRGRIESYYTRADGSAAITMEYLGVSPDGLKVELWSALEDDPGDALDSRAAACGDERGYAAASEAAARTTSDSRQFVRALAVVFRGEFDRVSCIAKILEMHAFDHSSRIDIKTWNDSDRQ